MSSDKFEATIVGTVERVRQYAKGDVVTVAYQANPNNKYPDRVTVWGVGQAPVAEGERVTVSGQVSVKVEEYNGKHRAQVSVNFPKWATEAAAPAAPVDEWATPAHDGDTPF